MTLINKIFKYIVSLSLILAIILNVVDICCFDKNFYYKQYEKNNTLELIHSDENNLHKITDNLLDYLKNKNDDINITYLKNNVETNVYQDIELIHMSDVKELYQSVYILKWIVTIIAIIGLIYFIFKKISFKKEFNRSLFLVIFALVLIGISCLVDFNSFWTSFHKVFFTKNDYWLLDPRTCILVNLFTSEFFFALCFKICIISIIVILLFFIFINYYEKKTFN